MSGVFSSTARAIRSVATRLTVGSIADGQVLKRVGTTIVGATDAGGDVAGAASSTDNAAARFDGTGGKTLQNSGVIIDDSGSVNIPTGQTYKINSVALAKGDVGLGSVDNTSDANKPVSAAQQTALNLKANLAGGNAFTGAQTVGVGQVTTGVTDVLINPTTKASGNLIDVQVNGASKFSCSFDGKLAIPSSSAAALNVGGGIISVNHFLHSAGLVGFSSSGGASGANHDVTISRNAAGVVQIGTTAANASGSFLATNGTLTGTLIGGVQALSGAGAVNVTNLSTAFTSTGVGDALTLADGANGQIKTIAHVSDGGTGVLTPTTKSGYSTITFTNIGDAVTLQFFTTAGWIIVGQNGVTVTP